MHRTLLGGLAALLVGGCGNSIPPTATATARPTLPPATPTPSLPPDVERIDVVATGLGINQLVTVPVAVLHNAASRTGATGVLVHLTPTRGGKPLTPLVSSAVTMYPGETLVVTANCTDTCQGADGVTVTVVPGTWGALSGSPPTATAGSFTCTVSCHGHGQWDVPVAVAGPALVQNEQVDLFAACSDAAGRIIGGGERQLLWPSPGGSLNLEVPVIVSSPPASCRVAATTSN